MNKLYSAIYTEKASGKVIFRLNQRKPLNKFFWEKDKLVKLDELSRKLDLPKSQIEIKDYSTWYEEETE